MQTQGIKRNYTRVIDLCLLFVYLIVSIVFFYISFRFGILPKKWLLYGAIVAYSLFCLFFVMTFKKLATWTIVTRRILLVCLSLLIAIGGILQNKSRATLEQIALSSEASTTINLYTIVSANSPIQTITDLTGKTIGFQTGVDKEHVAFAKQQLQKDIGSFTSHTQLDYTSLITNLRLKKINALVISQNSYNMAKANIKNFEEQITIIHTYKKKVLQPKSTLDMRKHTFTLYLSGIDNMGSPDQQTRSDTNLLFIVNPLANHINMVSLPRDGYMPNAAYNFVNDKLAHTGNDGVENSVKTIENFLGIPIDYYARVSFNSLIEIVDTLGGINVDVELKFCEQDENRSFAKEDIICLDKGKQKLSGKQALAYARHRKTASYGNPGRERAQQRIMKSIIQKIISPSGLTSIHSLLSIAPNYIMTNMPVKQISKFISNELEAMQPWTISTIPSNTGVTARRYVASLDASLGTSDVYLFHRNEIRAIVNAYDGAKKQLNMDTYAFDLNNLYKNTPPINTSNGIVYADKQ